MDKPVIEIDNVTVRFNKSIERVDNIKEYIVRLIQGRLLYQEFFALKNINLSVRSGESWGIVGTNGSGKSTLLKLICGILKPYKGSIRVYGSISPLIELGAGFDPDLTARENIYLNGAILGRTNQFMQNHYDEIVEFSELGDFMDSPIKNFSSGMYTRLGFALATVVKPDILIVDEILAVGDYAFQKKCKERMDQMLAGGTTLLFVSHAADEVKRLCSKAIWLNKGELAMTGSSQEVCDAYTASLNKGA